MVIKPGYSEYQGHEVCSRHCPAYKARTGRCAVNTDRVEPYAPCVPALVYHRTGGRRPAMLVIEGQR